MLLYPGIVLLSGVVAWRLDPTAGIVPGVCLITAFILLKRTKTRRRIKALSKGYLGERTVGKTLEKLPVGWRVFHDLDLDGENADHVVVGSKGVFVFEVKNYSGDVEADPTGLFTHGQRNDKVVRQVHRQARKLHELLGVEVQPVLVFTGSPPKGDRVGELPVLSARKVLPYLQSFTERVLTYEQARVIFEKLERVTK